MKPSSHTVQQAAAASGRGPGDKPKRTAQGSGDGKPGDRREFEDGSADSPARRSGADRPREREDRTLSNRPQDPNRLGGNKNFPPGVDPEDARDPGNQTPGAPPVDNRSGRRSGRG